MEVNKNSDKIFNLKCQNCNNYCSIFLCDQCIQNLSTQYDLNSEFKLILDEIELNEKKLEYNSNNGEYLIKEHCCELRRQVQLDKEIKIQQIENLSLKHIKQIDEYEKNSLEHYSKFDKQKYKNDIEELRLKVKKLDKEFSSLSKNNLKILGDFKYLSSTLEAKLEFLKYSLFENNQLLEFVSNHKSESLFGYLKLSSNDSIDFNQLYRIDSGKNFNKFILDKILYHLDRTDEETYFHITDTNYLAEDLIVLANFNYDDSTEIFLISINQQGEWNNFNCINNTDHTLYYNNMFYTSNNRICVSHYSNKAELFMEIYDKDLKRITKCECRNKRIIGANNENIFILSTSDSEDSLFIYIWSLECIQTIGQSSHPNQPFYFSSECIQMLSFCVNEIKYYFVRNLSEFHLINGLSGELVKTIVEKNVNKMHLDLDNKIILFKENSLKYFNSSGFFLKEVKLENFVDNLGRECLYFKKNKFYYFDPYLYYLAIDGD